MSKPIVRLRFAEWVADQIKAMAPYAKTIRPVGAYFATVGHEDLNVDFNRKVADYENHHFTTTSLGEYYGASRCTFDSEYGITLEYDSPDSTKADRQGRIFPKNFRYPPCNSTEGML